MSEISCNPDINEISKFETNEYKEIKPEGKDSPEDARKYWDELFDKNLLEKNVDDYFKDLKDNSEYRHTISEKPFETSDLEKISPEKNAEMREEFDDKKSELKREWEDINHVSWPKYDNDVYSSNGKLIRKAGSDYDAHHIQPLGMGGKNEATNITPLHAEVHFDKQGIHSPNSPYSRLDKMLGGID